MLDLERQIRGYATLVDEAAGTVEIDFAEPSVGRLPRPPRRRLALVLAFAAVVVVAVALVALLDLLAGEQPVIEEPVPTTVTTITPTTTAETTTPPTTQPPAPSIPAIGWTRVEDPAAFGGSAVQWINGVTAWPRCSTPSCEPVEILIAAGSVEASNQEQDAAVWVSGDGDRWERIDEELFGGPGSQNILGVTVSDDRVVAVGLDGGLGEGDDTYFAAAVWVSEDGGSTWARVPHDPDVFGAQGITRMMAVTSTEEGFVAAGDSFWWSADGLAWELADSDEPINLSDVGFEGFAWSVIPGGPGFVAVGQEAAQAAVWTSLDGRAWTQVLGQLDPLSGGAGLPQFLMRDVAEGPAGLVAVGARPESGDVTVWQSTDGVSWLRQPSDPSVFSASTWEEATGITRVGDLLVMVGNRDFGGGSAVWVSGNGGETWVRIPEEAAAFGNDRESWLRDVTAFGTELTPELPSRLLAVGGHADTAGIWIGNWDQ